MKISKTVISVAGLFLVGLVASSLLQRLDTSPNQNITTQTSYQRIVCLAPSVAEAVFALGCGDRVVGVSSWCQYPPEVESVEKLGGFINPNFERLTALQPDLVIFQGEFKKIADFCHQNNINTRRVHMSDLETIYHDITLLGQDLDCADRAESLCQQIRKDLAEIRTTVRNQKRPRIFFSRDRTAGSLARLATISGNSFISELISIAGGENIFADVEVTYPQISKESLLKRKPDIIIEVNPDTNLTQQQREQLKKDWLMLPDLPAVKNKRLYFPTDSAILVPGPRMAQAARTFAKIIHPEAFDE